MRWAYKNSSLSTRSSVCLFQGSGVTNNSWGPRQISKSSPLPFPYPHFPLPSVPISISPFSLSTLPTPLRSSLSFHFSPSLFAIISLPFPLSSPIVTARGTGKRQRYSSPSWSWLSPAAKRIFVQFTSKICKSVKSFAHVHNVLRGTRWRMPSTSPSTLPTLPTPIGVNLSK